LLNGDRMKNANHAFSLIEAADFDPVS
jgi:hypothetical protein